MLFEKYNIKNMELKNRIVMPPMCMYTADNQGYVNDWHMTHYTSRAIGQVGLIIVEATAVVPNGRISANDLGIWDDSHINGLSKLVNECQDKGTKMALQLAHAGRKCGVNEVETVAPSSFDFSDKYSVPKEITKDEIKNVINAFKEGARRADEAGFDAIEIHAAHGYLIHEFLSPIANKRNDEYGGSLENRTRFLKEIIYSIKEVWPKEKPIWIRVSADDYLEGGLEVKDIVDMINNIKEHIDMVHVSSGGIDIADINVYPGYQVKYSETIKEKCYIPTIAVGWITNYEQSEEIISNHRSDLVALGRELLRNPYWPIHEAMRKGIKISIPEQYERAIKL
ncbi:MAG: NADPH dehydrogenase NamA [Firmicutes bacterium]|nr:NADPH dehydrogenase NamA [Sporosalibacterium faouarense]MTI49346.1 NADPH dehydrogenase NamA [Bacillota bacterium]